ncbi:MAG: ABC transporter ATP-binding protein [Desulfovibrio sp.]|jgi:iron(III) transport system ATP-binding protein|nr:ABC transporter ATP-binding protein [Desulfovibrio sp.]
MFLVIDSLFFAYPDKNAPCVIAGYSLSMQQGERVGIAGPSGQGKSTLLRLIAGLEQPRSGSISIGGRMVVGNGVNVSPEKRSVGLVFQDYGLFPHMTVAQNIAYGLHFLSRPERKRRVEAMLALIRMEDLANRHPYAISGGQQQRVAVARAIAPNPKLLLLDEPFSNLDAKLKEEIRAEMRALLEKTGTTCIFVSHDLADLEAVCDRIESIAGE